MAIGVYCDKCKHKELEHKFDKWPCMDCCDGDRCDPITNADRIRAMSDEELAMFIHDQIIDRNIGIPSKTWLDWLKEEAKE